MTATSLAVTVAELDAVTWEMERRGLIAPDFGGWQRKHRPEFDWDAPHFDLLHGHLDRVTAGDLDRLLVQIAIRHGKTETLTGYIAYRIHKRPETQVLIATYNQRQAHKLSRAVKRIVKACGVEIGEKDAGGEWETGEGGGVLAVGAGTGVASVNAGLIVIDDPIGSRAEAESLANREGVWDWLTTDILARATPETAVVFSMPRWNGDDPSGRLQDQQRDRWTLIDLPCEALENDMLGRAPGELLWPSHRPRDWVDDRRVELGSYGFASAVQCRPAPRGGGMFKWDWWQLIDEVPASVPMIRYWDTAGTEATDGNDPDYTVGALLCRMRDGRTAIVDIERFRKSVAARDARILEVARSDLVKYPGRVRWWFEEEAGIAGKERSAELIRAVQNLGIPCYSERPTGSKVIRAEPLASKAEAGNVALCPGAWRDAFRLEASEFPNGKHDDQIDAAAGADAKLAVPVEWSQAPVAY